MKGKKLNLIDWNIDDFDNYDFISDKKVTKEELEFKRSFKRKSDIRPKSNTKAQKRSF